MAQAILDERTRALTELARYSRPGHQSMEEWESSQPGN